MKCCHLKETQQNPAWLKYKTDASTLESFAFQTFFTAGAFL